ncbi:Uncharacterised protein [Serratia liquefaciens]|nr:Uncharacterised protein [Serratia liquefaciens]CAI1543858.1 Uncharacterised protein [Serratia liquefaciens]
MCNVGNSSQSLRCRLAAVTGPAQAFEVRIIIGTPMCFRLDVVNRGGRYSATVTQAFLTQVIITRQNACSPDCPVVTIASLMPALTLLVILPACILVVGTVA